MMKGKVRKMHTPEERAANRRRLNAIRAKRIVKSILALAKAMPEDTIGTHDLRAIARHQLFMGLYYAADFLDKTEENRELLHDVTEFANKTSFRGKYEFAVVDGSLQLVEVIRKVQPRVPVAETNGPPAPAVKK